MDKHLNVFYAYRHGNYRDTERQRILEDNVTRALIVTLQSSNTLTREFLKKFACVNSSGPFGYDLQSKLRDVNSEAKNGQRLPSKRLIVIDKRAECPRTMKIADWILDDFESQLEYHNSHKRLRNRLSRLCDDIREESLKKQEIECRLKWILEIEDKNTEGSGLDHPDLPPYLHDLTRGSRPDGSITSGNVNVLFENKLHSGVTDLQIRRHLRESFGEGFQPGYCVQPTRLKRGGSTTIPVLIWSWSDVHEFFSEFVKVKGLVDEPVSNFLVAGMLKLLEMQNMGPVKFTQDDFLIWESETDGAFRRVLHDRVKELGEDLAESLGKHVMKPQNVSRDYVGINLLDESVLKGNSKISPEQVPHFSLGLERNKRLVLYVLCESKPLIGKLIKKRGQLESRIMETFLKMDSLAGLNLVVQHKLHVIVGGKGKRAPFYDTYMEFPLERYARESALRGMVSQVFDAIEHLHKPETKSNNLRAAGLGGKASSWGLFRLDYVWNWFMLEKEGERIRKQVIDTARMMRPYYDAIMEDYRSK